MKIVPVSPGKPTTPNPGNPQTGDRSIMGFWIGLGAIALGGLAAGIIMYSRKKKRMVSDEKGVYLRPFGWDVQENIERAKRYSEYALRCGGSGHPAFYALCLDDSIRRNVKWAWLLGCPSSGFVMKFGCSVTRLRRHEG